MWLNICQKKRSITYQYPETMKNIVTFVVSLLALISLIVYAWWPEPNEHQNAG